MRLSWRATNALFLATTAVQFTSEGHITAFTPLLLHDLGLSEAEVAVWSGLLAALRSVPVAFSNTILFAHQARVLPRDLQTVIFSLAPVPRNAGGLVFPLIAAAAAGLAPGAALAVGAVSYGGTFLTGVVMTRVTREAKP